MNEKDVLIITDLNLDEETAELVDQIKNKILIDHHVSKLDEKYDWYIKDQSFCGTSLYVDLVLKKDKRLF